MTCGSRLTDSAFIGMKVSNTRSVFVLVCRLLFKIVETISLEEFVYATSMLFMIKRRKIQ